MKKRVISLLLALVLALGLLPTAAWAAEVPKAINSADDFKNMLPGGKYILKQDITVKEPYASDFSGTFDGNGYTITLEISSNGANYVGLFKKLAGGATIKNVITTGFVTVDTTAKNKNHVGGIAGSVNTYSGNIAIEKCQNKASITGWQSVGGILGSCTYSNGHSVSIIECANTGDIISKATQAGGIVGSVSGGHTIQNCYNRGTITANSDKGGIAGFAQNASPVLEKCYTTGDVEVIGRNKNNVAKCTACYKLASTTDKNIKQLGSPFVADENNINDGYPILSWQKTSGGGELEPPKPGISISGTKTLWTVAGGTNATQATLTVSYADMGDEKPAVTWGYPAESDAAAFAEADGALVVNALGKTGGTEKVTASVQYNENTYKAECTITVIPYITSVDIVNLENGVIAPGQTVEAQVSVGGKPYLASYPELKYQWWHYNTSTGNADIITNATGKSYTIPETYAYNRIQVEVTCNGVTVSAHDQHKTADVLSGDDALLAFDKAALTRAVLGAEGEDIKSARTLNLAKTGTVKGSAITWRCVPEGVIDTLSGKVTLPESGKVSVTLTAVFSREDTVTTMSTPFTYTVWSQAAVEEEANDKRLALNNDIDAAKLSTLVPVCGTDTNVLTMVKNRLGREDITVMMGTPVRTNATANMAEEVTNIANDGTITYFYIDPNSDPMQNLQRFGTFSVPFTFARDGVSVTRNVSVTVYWDRGKVTKAMKDQIVPGLPKISGEVTEISPLPSTVNNKTWTGIEWSSNDNAITFKKPAATDPFGPWEVVVRGSSVEKTVKLTAKLTFRYTNDVTGSEKPITLLHSYTVTVPASADGLKYQEALDAVFGEGSLTDAASGERLAAANGVFTVRNDVQFPTTRDLGAYMMEQFGEGYDGKYTPLVITSSAPAVIAEPDVANAARVAVYRPAVGQGEETVTLTVKILDRPSGEGRDYASMPVLAEKTFTIAVEPLTRKEVGAELALMAEVKAHYWDGIKNGNTAAGDVTGDLAPFVEVYKQDGALVWVRDVREMKNSGIVPAAMDGWQELEAWRLFRSSNPAAVTHENLLVTQQFEGKAVTVTSALSSETLGRYGELYRKDPGKYAAYAACDGLYYQPVRAELVVRGRNTAHMKLRSFTVNNQTIERLVSEPRVEKVSVSFTLSGNGELWLGTRTLRDLDEGVTVFDVLRQLRDEGVLSFEHKGGYVQSITCGGKTLAEQDEGKNSGWLYTVNGELPDVYMSAYGLKNGDSVRVYFTKDYTKEPGADRWKPVTPVTKTETVTNADGSTTKTETKPDGTTIETTTKLDGSTTVAETKPDGSVSTVEKRADGTEIKTAQPASGGITASVSVPKSVGSTRVDIPVSKPSGSMVAVIVHPDGTEEIVRGSVVTETGIALRAEGDVRLKIIDNAKRFNDMADHWAKDAVEFASSRELFNGVGNDAFGPDRSMTRGMVSTVLARLAGADTAGGETWYAKGTVWAVENGISDGTAPEQPVTREQLAAMLYRYAGSPAVSGELSFDDTTVISIWAYDAVRWCVDNGILNGVGGNRMTPQDLAQRGQVAAMLMRFLQATV